MDKLVVKGDKIEEYVNLVSHYISDFTDIVRYLDNEKNKLLWESDNYLIMIEKYNDMIKDYIAYIDRMTKLMNYLERTLYRYDETVANINHEYRKIDDENTKGGVRWIRSM